MRWNVGSPRDGDSPKLKPQKTTIFGCFANSRFGSKSKIRIIWRFRKIGLLRNHQFWGTPVVGNPPVVGWGTRDQWGTPLTSYHGKPWMIFPERGVPQVTMGLNTKVVVYDLDDLGYHFFFGQSADKTSTDVNFEYWIVTPNISQHELASPPSRYRPVHRHQWQMM